MAAKRKSPAARTPRVLDGVVAGDNDTPENAVNAGSVKRRSWRDVLPVHPAADLFPMMSQEELKALAKDIAEHGLREPIVLIEVDDSPLKLKRRRNGKPELPVAVLDGRNRLAAIEASGFEIDAECLEKYLCLSSGEGAIAYKGDDEDESDAPECPVKFALTSDPYSYVISANIHRRHLSAEQKRELIAKLLRANPRQSNRQIAEQVKADDKTVGKVRRKLQATAEIPQLAKTTGKDGKARTSTPKKPVDVVPERLPPSTDGIPDIPSFLVRNMPTKPVAVQAVITVEMIKAHLVRFDDAELDDLRRVLDAEIEERRAMKKALP